MTTRCAAIVLVASLFATPALAQQPAPGSWRAEVQRLRDSSALLRGRERGKVDRSVTRARSAMSLAEAIAESEPNDNAGTADSVALGDRVTGVVSSPGDVDTWFVDLTAGEFLSVDVDAKSIGSILDPTLALFAPDGTTLLAFNDDFDGFDSRISYRVTVPGRYFVAIRAFGDLGDPRSSYIINFGKVVCAAGNTEQEPNDSPGSATRITLEGSGTGEVCTSDDSPLGDVDYWTFTAQAGTTIELDVDLELGTFGDPFLALFASDGITRLAFNNDQDELDSRLQYSITATDTYFAAVSSVADPGGNPFPYTLHARTTAQGPGDPIRVRFENLGTPLGLAIGNTGDLFIGDLTGSRIVRVSRTDGVTTFAAGITSPLGLAFDASGNLLVASVDGVVYRVTPAGEVSPFISDTELPFWIAVGPDGRIWLTDVSARSLRRYSATGQFEASFDGAPLGGFGPGPIAIAPTGEPYVSTGAEIWKLESGRFQRVFSDTVLMWAFAFDVKGNLYVPAPVAGRITLFDPVGRREADPFAVGPDAPQVVAFARDAFGTTVQRLFATEPRTGQLIEVNPAGIREPGLPVGFVPQPFAADVAAEALLGGVGLSTADLEHLDALGNQNGRYDVGDLQAFLRAVGGLPDAASIAAYRQRRSNR